MAAASVCAPVSLRILNSYRYAEWATLDRAILDSMIFSLPMVTLLSMAIARQCFAENSIWQLPHQLRAGVSAARSAVAVGVSAAAGTILGWAPVFAWGFATATYGHPSYLSLLGALLWVVACALLSVSVTAMTRSIWPAIGLSVFWVLAYQYGRITGVATSPREAPATRISMFPFDGVYQVIAAPLHQNPLIPPLRILGALLAIMVSIVALRRCMPESTVKQRVARGLGNWVTIVAVAVFLGAATQTIAVAATEEPPVRCVQRSLRVCLYSAHSSDLPVASTAADTLKRRASEFSAELVTEEAPDGPTTAHVSVYTEVTNSVREDVITQLVGYTFDPRGCYASSDRSDYTVQAMLTRWLMSLINGRKPSTVGLDRTRAAQLSSWADDPAETQSRLRQIWPQIQRCNVTVDELPK